MRLPPVLRIIAWTVLASYLLVVVGATRCQAQSTPSGRVFNAPDVAWERFQAHNPWAYRLDDRAWKTWGWHGAADVVGGYALSWVTPMKARTGRKVMCGFYLVREVINWREHNCRCFDSFMDVAVPCTVARIRW